MTLWDLVLEKNAAVSEDFSFYFSTIGFRIFNKFHTKKKKKTIRTGPSAKAANRLWSLISQYASKSAFLKKQLAGFQNNLVATPFKWTLQWQNKKDNFDL